MEQIVKKERVEITSPSNKELKELDIFISVELYSCTEKGSKFLGIPPSKQYTLSPCPYLVDFQMG